ncbi:MAG: M48 family metallopeptidase [Bacteroidales bacterium]
MESIVFTLVIVALAGDYLLNVILEIININYSKNRNLDKAVADVYDTDSYYKQQDYNREKLILSLVESTLTTVLAIVIFAVGGFGVLNTWVSSIASNSIVQSLLFFGILWFAGKIIALPFNYFDNFIIEEKYGFNNSTKTLFLTDILKSSSIAIIFGGVILLLITWLYVNYTSLFWLPVLLFLLLISLLSTVLYTSIILPLFNKKTPLADGNLKERLEKLAQKAGFSTKSIFILDSSRRSTKANAFFTGWGGRNKRIYLYDTLIDRLEPVEIEAVLAHEIGHYKKNHIWYNFVIGLAVTGFFLFVFSKISMTDIFTPVMGAMQTDNPNFQLNILGFALILEPIQNIINILTSYLSRKMEFSADGFAKGYNLAGYLVSALKKLAALNYSTLMPHPLYVKFHYSHPPLGQRIIELQQQ